MKHIFKWLAICLIPKTAISRTEGTGWGMLCLPYDKYYISANGRYQHNGSEWNRWYRRCGRESEICCMVFGSPIQNANTIHKHIESTKSPHVYQLKHSRNGDLLCKRRCWTHCARYTHFRGVVFYVAPIFFCCTFCRVWTIEGCQLKFGWTEIEFSIQAFPGWPDRRRTTRTTATTTQKRRREMKDVHQQS